MSGRKGMRILWRRIGDGREISTFIIMIVLSERVWNGNGGSIDGCELGGEECLMAVLWQKVLSAERTAV
jgi:hypothetical protein